MLCSASRIPSTTKGKHSHEHTAGHRHRRVSRCVRAALACAAAFAATAGPASAAVHSNVVATTLPAGDCNQTPATPYPSQIVVSGETGVISDVT